MYLQNSILLPKFTQKKPRGSHFYSVCLTWTQRKKKKTCHVDVWNQTLKNWLDFMYIVSGLERGNCLHEDPYPCIWEKNSSPSLEYGVKGRPVYQVTLTLLCHQELLPYTPAQSLGDPLKPTSVLEVLTRYHKGLVTPSSGRKESKEHRRERVTDSCGHTRLRWFTQPEE